MAGIAGKMTPPDGSRERAMAPDPRLGPLGQPRADGVKPDSRPDGARPEPQVADPEPGPLGQNRRPDIQGARRALACTALSAWAGEAAIGCYSGHDKDKS